MASSFAAASLPFTARRLFALGERQDLRPALVCAHKRSEEEREGKFSARDRRNCLSSRRFSFSLWPIVNHRRGACRARAGASRDGRARRRRRLIFLAARRRESVVSAAAGGQQKRRVIYCRCGGAHLNSARREGESEAKSKQRVPLTCRRLPCWRLTLSACDSSGECARRFAARRRRQASERASSAETLGS